jgi:hypothetical protein
VVVRAFQPAPVGPVAGAAVSESVVSSPAGASPLAAASVREQAAGAAAQPARALRSLPARVLRAERAVLASPASPFAGATDCAQAFGEYPP